jgi:hypothetical protein
VVEQTTKIQMIGIAFRTPSAGVSPGFHTARISERKESLSQLEDCIAQSVRRRVERQEQKGSKTVNGEPESHTSIETRRGAKCCAMLSVRDGRKKLELPPSVTRHCPPKPLNPIGRLLQNATQVRLAPHLMLTGAWHVRTRYVQIQAGCDSCLRCPLQTRMSYTAHVN